MLKKIGLVIFILLLLVAGIGLYELLSPKQDENVLTLFGNVDVRQVDIGFRVPGRVDKIYFEEGDLVKPDDLLAELDNTPYISQLAQAKANAEAAKINLDNSDKLLKRRQELIGIGGVSQEDLESTSSSRESLAASLTSSQASQVVSSDNLSFTKAFAPTAGVILTRIREPGSVVNPGDPVYTISITSPVWIRAFVSEPQLGQICYGMTATISTDTPGAKNYTGKIGFISPIAEFTPKTVETTKLRTDLVYRLRIYVDNPDCTLKQGMPVTVKLDVTSATRS
jgi:HlyD family secretion protein